MLKSFILFFILITTSANTFAQTCCSGGVPISGNLGMPQGSHGTWQISLSYDFNFLKTLKEGNSILDDNSRERITHSYLVQTGYTINKKMSADLLLPFVKQERTIRQFNSQDYVSTNGIGDIALLYKYNVTSVERNKIALTLAMGPKIPTGRTDFTRADGIPLNADLQPGSGSWDGLFWANGLYQLKWRPSMNISNTFIYSIKGKNRNYLNGQTYQFGDELQWLLSFNDRFKLNTYMLDATLLLRYRKALNDRFNDLNMPNTGGEWLFLAPMLGFSFNQNIAINVTFEIPLYANVAGTQLSPTYRLNAGIFIKINKKNELLKL